MKKNVPIFFVVVLLFCVPLWADDLKVHIINVGQADAILITCPCGDHQLLIDAGALGSLYTGSPKAFKDYMLNHQNSNDHIEVVVASHTHADHIGNMKWVLENFQVDLYVDNGKDGETATYDALELEVVQLTAFNRHQDTLGGNIPDIDFCTRNDVTATLLIPDDFNNDRGSDPNTYSLVVRVIYDNTSFLFVGDADDDLEQLLIDDTDTVDLLDCDFLKVGHHGSKTASTAAFIAKVTPDFAVLSVGAKGISKNMGYKHPNYAPIITLLSFLAPRNGMPIGIEAFDAKLGYWKYVIVEKQFYSTNNEGTISFKSDGTTIKRIH